LYLDLNARRTALYRLYDKTGTLLYIGISHQPEVRFEQHADQKEWWPLVDRREIAWFDDRPSAALAEAAAIRAEDPEHNGTYSPRRSRKSIRHVIAADGIEEISMTLARSKLTSLIRKAEAGSPVALLNHGRRDAIIVSREQYEEIMAIRRIAEFVDRLKEGDASNEQAAARVLRDALDTAKRRALDSS
jgi:prevent-host-death family protein